MPWLPHSLYWFSQKTAEGTAPGCPSPGRVISTGACQGIPASPFAPRPRLHICQHKVLVPTRAAVCIARTQRCCPTAVAAPGSCPVQSHRWAKSPGASVRSDAASQSQQSCAGGHGSLKPRLPQSSFLDVAEAPLGLVVLRCLVNLSGCGRTSPAPPTDVHGRWSNPTTVTISC